MATKAQLQEIINRALAAGPGATPASQGWLRDAAALVAPKVDATTPRDPLPLLAVVEVRSGTSKRDGKPYSFPVLNIHNGKNGSFHRGSTLDARYLARILDWFGTPDGQAFMKTRQLVVKA